MTTRKTSKPKRGAIQFESPHYRVYELQPDILYVKKTKQEEIPDILERVPRMPADAKGFIPYRYLHPFTSEDNDCLKFAEKLAKGDIHYKADACVYGVGGKAFGHTDVKNMQLARKHKKNEKADPKPGQAFAIVRTNLIAVMKKEEAAPYHIAHVILTDGDWRVTLEANAGDPDMERPEFGIYSVTDPVHSFHRTYKSLYGVEKAATVVLEKR